jgi:uncharacterized membrane protein
LVPPREDPGFRRQRIAVALVGALVLMEILWETVWAPVRPGGSWIALKAIPLAFVWLGMARGHARARQVASLLLPFYVGEAVVRGVTEPGRHAAVAWSAAALGMVAFVALMLSFRASRGSRTSRRH